MLIERRSEPETAHADKGIVAAWEDVRCRNCRRLLAKNTRDALRPGGMLEVKCSSCNTLNFLVGRPDDD